MEVNTEETKVDEGLKSRVDKCYSAKTSAQLREVYDEWATLYEADLVAELGWDGPKQAVEYLIKYTKPEDRILDVGAGTGLVGDFLSKEGYQKLEALDMSEKMLEQAQKKNVYEKFHYMTLGVELDIPSNSYDSIIAVGVFTEGHAPAHSIDELVRITKSGGYIVFSLRPDVHENMGFKEVQDRLQAEGLWKLTEVSPFLKGFHSVQTQPYKVWIYQVS